MATYRIAGNLKRYISIQPLNKNWLSLSRLEREVFGDVDSNISINFWSDIYNQLRNPGCTYQYLANTYALFMAMSDQEIDEIRDSYFNNEEERIQLNRSAV